MSLNTLKCEKCGQEVNVIIEKYWKDPYALGLREQGWSKKEIRENEWVWVCPNCSKEAEK